MRPVTSSPGSTKGKPTMPDLSTLNSWQLQKHLTEQMLKHGLERLSDRAMISVPVKLLLAARAADAAAIGGDEAGLDLTPFHGDHDAYIVAGVTVLYSSGNTKISWDPEVGFVSIEKVKDHIRACLRAIEEAERMQAKQEPHDA